jgi:DHA2 family multidrug resistance protein
MKNSKAVLITLMLGTSMAALDSSIVNVSLPVIQKQFGVSINSIEWVILGYMISFCLFIPLTNWLKSRIGYFNLFIFSVAIFTIGSLLCSLSGNLSILVMARVFQAIGGGAISPTSLAILSDSFPREKRGSAIGWWGIGNVMGPAIGPTLGGVLSHYFGWPSIFYINIPIGIATIFLSFIYLKFLRTQQREKLPFDTKGYLFFGIFIVLLQYSLTLVSDLSLAPWKYTGGFILSFVSLYLFIRSARSKTPLIDITVFKSQTFINCSIIIIIRSLALYGGLFFIPFLLQGLMGYSEVDTGLLLLPNALMMLLFRPYAGRLADKGIIRRPSVTGIVFIAISMGQFAYLNVGDPIWLIVLAMMVRGFGMSLLVSPVSTALLNSVNEHQTATATSINSLLQQVGGSVGIAVSGILHVYINQYFVSKGRLPNVAEHLALKDGFIISAVLIFLAILPAIRLPDKRKDPSVTADKLKAVTQ